MPVLAAWVASVTVRQLKPFDTDEMTFLVVLMEPEASIYIAALDGDPASICL